MGLKLIRSKSKSAVAGFIPKWYGFFRSGGVVKTIPLSAALHGVPPASGDLREKGDDVFERSRAKAQAELDRITEAAKAKDADVRETRHIIEAKTGKKFSDPKLSELADLYLRRLGDRSPCHVAMIRSCFAHFDEFAARPIANGDGRKKKIPSARTLQAVTPELAVAFFAHVSTIFSFSTVKRWSNLLSSAYSLFVPNADNPFKGARVAAVGRAQAKRDEDGERVKVEEEIHHKPLDRAQLGKLYAAAKNDELLYSLAVTCASTGLRVGDACVLKWSDVDLDGGVITLTAQKTGARVGVPIFSYNPGDDDFDADLGEFRRVLEAARDRSDARDKYVFPKAAKLYLSGRAGRDRIYAAGKTLFAKALYQADGAVEDADLLDDGEGSKPPKTPEEIVAAIEAAEAWTPERRKRTSEIYRAFSGGSSYNEIASSLGYAKSTISTDLDAVEELTGAQVKPRSTRHGKAPSVRKLLELTRQKRQVGKRSASAYSWHSLRGSFVVLMLDNGVPLDTVRQLVGHTTSDMTLSYFNPTEKQAAEKARRIIAHRNRVGARGARPLTLPPPGAKNAAEATLDALRAALANLGEDERRKLLAGIN